MFVSPSRRCACGIMDFASCSSSLFSDSHPIPRRPRSQAGFELEDVCGTLMRFGACMAHLCGCTYLLSRSEYLTKTKTDARWTCRFSHTRQRPKACVRARTFGPASRGAAWSEAGEPARPISLTPGPCVRRPKLLSLPRSTRSRCTAHHFTSSGVRVDVVDVECTKTAHLQHTMYQSARMCRPRVPDPINHRRPLLNIMTRTTGLAPLCCSGMTI